MKRAVVYLITISFISATVPKDICDTCVPTNRCPLFRNLSSRDQQLWMERFPCRGSKLLRNNVPPGFAPYVKGDYVCCSNNIWGVENSGTVTLSTNHESTDYRPHNLDHSNGFQYNDLINGENPVDFNMKYTNTNNGNVWYPGVEQNHDNRNLWNNQQHELSGHNKDTGNTNRWTNNRKKYWNERPDPSDRLKNQNTNNNYWHNNNGQDRRYENNYGRYDRPPYRNDYNSRNAQKPYDNNWPQFPNYNNRGHGRNENNFQTNNRYPYPTTHRPSNNNRNDGPSTGKCDRLTSFPPDPQSGCCGREAADDDRITEKNPRTFALTNTVWAQLTYQETDALLQLKDEKQTGDVGGNGNDTIDVKVETRISGGRATELYQYPWTVLLLTTFDYGDRQASFNCGGSLISARYVLSAGHCVYDKDAYVKSVQVYLAEYDKRTFPRDCKVSQGGRKCIENIVMYAENIILHPQYENENLLNDISLLRLQYAVPYTEYIRPICLPSINIDEPQFANLQFEVAGWGRNGQFRSDVKQSTTLHLVNQNECKKFYPMLTNKHLCAAGYKGEDTCKGDSGGPLMTLYRGRYYVTGVVSGKRADSPCGTAVPSLYTNVYHYLNWIRSNIRN